MTHRLLCAFACLLAVLFGAAAPIQAGPKVIVKSATREGEEKFREVAKELLLARKKQQADRIGGQIPPMIYSGECLGCGDDMVLITPSPSGSGEATVNINGGLIIPGFREGWTFGTIEFGGVDMLQTTSQWICRS